MFLRRFEGAAGEYVHWDSKTSPEDMLEMWNNSEVSKEWTKSGERRGKVRFSHDKDKRPYLSRVEVKVCFQNFAGIKTCGDFHSQY